MLSTRFFISSSIRFCVSSSTIWRKTLHEWTPRLQVSAFSHLFFDFFCFSQSFDFSQSFNFIELSRSFTPTMASMVINRVITYTWRVRMPSGAEIDSRKTIKVEAKREKNAKLFTLNIRDHDATYVFCFCVYVLVICFSFGIFPLWFWLLTANTRKLDFQQFCECFLVCRAMEVQMKIYFSFWWARRFYLNFNLTIVFNWVLKEFLIILVDLQ